MAGFSVGLADVTCYSVDEQVARSSRTSSTYDCSAAERPRDHRQHVKVWFIGLWIGKEVDHEREEEDLEVWHGGVTQQLQLALMLLLETRRVGPRILSQLVPLLTDKFVCTVADGLNRDEGHLVDDHFDGVRQTAEV